MRGSRFGLKPLVASGAYNPRSRMSAANEGIQWVKRAMHSTIEA